MNKSWESYHKKKYTTSYHWIPVILWFFSLQFQLILVIQVGIVSRFNQFYRTTAIISITDLLEFPFFLLVFMLERSNQFSPLVVLFTDSLTQKEILIQTITLTRTSDNLSSIVILILQSIEHFLFIFQKSSIV